MEQRRIDPAQVRGWGIDADPKNDPTYPMKTRTDAERAGYTWERPTQQQTGDVEVLHSIERPNLPAVFGTASPPSGLSGMIRREAFKYSESTNAHWMPLMLADRVNVVEGVLSDLVHGHVPNVLGEVGIGAEWEHDRRNLVTGLVFGALVASAAVLYLRGSGKAGA